MFTELKRGRTMWDEIWLPLLRDPTAEKFSELVRQPDATLERGLIWIFWATLFSSITNVVLMGGFLALFVLSIEDINSSIILWIGLGILIVIPIFTVFGILNILFNGGVMHIAATQFFKGDATFDQLVYGISLYTAPIYLINAALIFIPVIGWSIIWLVGIYAIILQVLALRGVYEFDWIKAIVVATVPYALNQILWLGCYFVFIFSIFGALATSSNP